MVKNREVRRYYDALDAKLTSKTTESTANRRANLLCLLSMKGSLLQFYIFSNYYNHDFHEVQRLHLDFGALLQRVFQMLPDPTPRGEYAELLKRHDSIFRNDIFRPFTKGTDLASTQSNLAVRERPPLPDKPPYTAHLANLSFDVAQPDIEDFFRACKVINVRIVEDKIDRKPTWFGYVEFSTLDGLKAALDLSGQFLAGRQVKISVADPPKNESSRDSSIWSRKGPLPSQYAKPEQRHDGKIYHRQHNAEVPLLWNSWI